MAKLTLNDITSGYASNDLLDANFALIEAALENTLSLDGTTPNSMTADLDLNGNALLNVSTWSAGSSGGVTGSRPASPNDYQMYFDTTLGIPIWYTGSDWVDATGASA